MSSCLCTSADISLFSYLREEKIGGSRKRSVGVDGQIQYLPICAALEGMAFMI